MEVNFDKQIDTILRDLAKGNVFAESPPVSHLDADELSAFAENALPAKARLRAMEHLADCSNCRKTLTTFFSLDNETQSETIHDEVKTIAAIPSIPWYSKFFAFSQLSYTMGALALLLTGMIGFLLFQSGQDSKDSVAMNEPVAEKSKGPSGASSEGETPAFETYSTNSSNTVSNAVAPASNAVSSVANSATNSSANPSSPTLNGNSPADSAPKPLATPATVGSANTATSSDAPIAEKSTESDRDKKDAKEEIVSKGGGERKPPANEVATSATPTPSARQQVDDNMAQQRVEPQQNRAQNNAIMPDGATETKRSAPPSAPSARKTAGQREDSTDEEAKKNKVVAKPAPTKDVAGKTFRSANGIWTDSAYKGGSTTNVKRGTGEYKKLDSGLRSITDHLGGTVIIVWKTKNYKIQ